MPAEDLSSAQLEAEPLAPLGPLTRGELVGLGTRIAKRTWADGVDRWFWGEGVALDGLAAFGRSSGSDDAEEVAAWVERRLERPMHVVHVNELAPAAAAVGVGLAKEVEQFADWVAEAPRAPSGAIEHWPGGLWADTMFMAGAFLARLGRATGDDRMIEEAARQYLLHAEVLQDDRRGLFAHGSHRGETIWCFWGRANAWAALAAVEVLEAAAGSHVAGEDEIRQRLSRQLRSLVSLQPEHGVWDVLVDRQPETAGILETSAAAGIASAMLRAAALDPLAFPEARSAGSLALRGCLAHVDADGHLTRVSAGTILQLLPFGYSVVRSDRPQPWGQGLALSAIAAALAAPGEGSR